MIILIIRPVIIYIPHSPYLYSHSFPYLLDLVRKAMEINVTLKIRSLIRRRLPFFCLSYDFDNRAIDVHPTHAHYYAELLHHKNAGYVKRA